MPERNTWPLWQSLKPETLAGLIQYQARHYETTLHFRSDAFRDVESLEEIDRLMRQRPEYVEVDW